MAGDIVFVGKVTGWIKCKEQSTRHKARDSPQANLHTQLNQKTWFAYFSNEPSV